MDQSTGGFEQEGKQTRGNKGIWGWTLASPPSHTAINKIVLGRVGECMHNKPKLRFVAEPKVEGDSKCKHTT